MRNDRGYTYLITNGREYKIGMTTKTPQSRVAELQTGSPTKISISGYSYNSNALAMEIELHKKFASKRLEGEWFVLDDDDVAMIHHHFENNHIDEYLAPLSARAVEIKRQAEQKHKEHWEFIERLRKEQNELREQKKGKITRRVIWTISLAILAYLSYSFVQTQAENKRIHNYYKQSKDVIIKDIRAKIKNYKFDNAADAIFEYESYNAGAKKEDLTMLRDELTVARVCGRLSVSITTYRYSTAHNDNDPYQYELDRIRTEELIKKFESINCDNSLLIDNSWNPLTDGTIRR